MIAKRATESKQYHSGFKSRFGQSSKWKISSNNERRNTLKFPHSFIARVLIRPRMELRSQEKSFKPAFQCGSKYWFKTMFYTQTSGVEPVYKTSFPRLCLCLKNHKKPVLPRKPSTRVPCHSMFLDHRPPLSQYLSTLLLFFIPSSINCQCKCQCCLNNNSTWSCRELVLFQHICYVSVLLGDFHFLPIFERKLEKCLPHIGKVFFTQSAPQNIYEKCFWPLKFFFKERVFHWKTPITSCHILTT